MRRIRGFALLSDTDRSLDILALEASAAVEARLCMQVADANASLTKQLVIVNGQIAKTNARLQAIIDAFNVTDINNIKSNLKNMTTDAASFVDGAASSIEG